VANNLALKHLGNIKKGDRAFIYHTGTVRAVTGIAEITSSPYPDPALEDPRMVVVDLRPVEEMGRPVSLSEIKSDPSLSDFPLVRIPRLSVMPVSLKQWKKVLAMAEKSA